MTDLWDPERLRVIGSVMERYAEHLKEGHRVRLGMEGDPCGIYRATEDVPVGTVVSVQRPVDETGVVRFTLRMDTDDTLVELDNRTVDPSRVWEISPDFLDEYRRSVEDDMLPSSSTTRADDADDDEYRGQTEARFGKITSELERLHHLHDDVERLRERDESFRAATTSTLRYLAADLLRLSKGGELEFSAHYADRYDDTMTKRDEDYRGEVASSRIRQKEKTHFSTDDHMSRGSDVQSLVYGSDALHADTTSVLTE